MNTKIKRLFPFPINTVHRYKQQANNKFCLAKPVRDVEYVGPSILGKGGK